MKRRILIEPTHISDKIPNAEGGYSYSYAYGASFFIKSSKFFTKLPTLKWKYYFR